jgi:hypothetical protein
MKNKIKRDVRSKVFVTPSPRSSPLKGEEEYGGCPTYCLILRELGERGFDCERLYG